MKKSKLTLLSLLLLGSVSVTGCYVDLGFVKLGKKPAESDNSTTPGDKTPIDNGNSKYTGNYYDSLDSSLSGTRLLAALKKLNSEKRKSLVGYNKMGTDSSGKFCYTDYSVKDPSKVFKDENGQPYGTKVVSFYSGSVTMNFNREHVWPNTHGGHLVEDDIHMVRPTIESENGARGHSFYIEGANGSGNNGWDPAMESFGKESYRGDAARIIFYCMVASDQLKLTDDASRSSDTNNYEMGLISDMVAWNAKYPVLDREQRRNSGAEYLQGNRNPFIDHPEYACRIWGSTSQKAKSACQAAHYAVD